MNSFIATVLTLKNSQSLHIVKFSYRSQILCMMSLELDARIKKGTEVSLSIKPTHVVLSKNFTGDISFENHLLSRIISIDDGELLSSVTLSFLDTEIEAIITKEVKEAMKLEVGDEVIALIQASKLSIMEVLDV